MCTAPRDGSEILILTAHGAHAMYFHPGEPSLNYYDNDGGEDDGWFAVDHQGYVIEDLTIYIQYHTDNNGYMVAEEPQALGWMQLPVGTILFRKIALLQK